MRLKINLIVSYRNNKSGTVPQHAMYTNLTSLVYIYSSSVSYNRQHISIADVPCTSIKLHKTPEFIHSLWSSNDTLPPRSWSVLAQTMACHILEPSVYLSQSWLNTLRPRRNEQHFADDIFKLIFFNENVWISIKISLKFVPKGPINNIPALVQIMAWRRSGDKPLSEPNDG